MKILIYTTLDQSLQNELWKQLPPESELIFKSNLSEPKLKDAFYSADIVMGNPPPTWFTDAPTSLKFWQIDSAGFNQYQGIKLNFPIANMGDFFAHECAETVIGGILALYRSLNHLIRFQIKKEWKAKQIRSSMESLGDKRILILGSGTIGLAVKKILDGFGSQIKTSAHKNPIADFHSFEDVLKHLPEIDLVINTLPGTAEKYVSQSFLNAMPLGSVYANVGRGNTTDEKALIAALETGKLAGAVLDVTEKEPLPTDSPLWEMENVILTQHTAGGSKNEIKGKVNLFISNFYKFQNKEKIKNLIILKSGY